MPPRSSAARMLGMLVLLLALVVAAVLVLLWPRSRVLAFAAAAAVAVVHAWLLAFEFFMLPRASHGDPLPLPRPRDRLRAWWAEALLDIQVFAWRQPFAWRALPDDLGPGLSADRRLQGRRGVVLVHGYLCNRGFWHPWMRELRRRGHPYLALNLEPVFAPIEAHAHALESAIRKLAAATGVPPLLVCHSMGGLIPRAWLRLGGDLGSVAHVVTIATPHHGTWLAKFSHTITGRQMRRGAPWLTELERAWRPEFGVKFTCWRSNCDNVVLPPSTATLPGADNRHLEGPAHVELAFRSEVMQATLALLDSPSNPGEKQASIRELRRAVG